MVLLCSSPGISQTRLDSIKASFLQEEQDSLKIIYELDLARELHRQAHDEEVEYAYSKDALERALHLNDTLLYARALDNFGLLYRYHQRYEEAITYHQKAYNLIKDKKVDPIYKMIFANNVGVAGRYNEKYDFAISYYMKALRIAEEENDLKNIAISSNGIGNALGNIPGRSEEALPYFERSLEAERKRKNSLGVAMNYLSISDHYIQTKQFSKAREFLHELLEINQDRKDAFGLAITYEFLGISYLAEGGDVEKASSYFNNALIRFRELNNNHKQSEILVSLGDIELVRNRLVSAKEYYENSLELAEELNQHGLLMTNYFKLSNILEMEDNPRDALMYYKLGKAYEDSIKLTQQEVEIASLIRKYDLEKKESHIQLLEKDKFLQQTRLDIQQQQLKKRRAILFLMGFILFSILIILFLQYRNYRTKKKSTEIILKEEKEKLKAIYERNLARAEILVTRLRINPHFLFNSLNAITYLIQSEQNSKAVKYLVVFSRYTRMVLETSQKHIVPLTEELKLTQYYLTLEENRFESDFAFSIMGMDAPEIRKAHIPPLLLQPFIENAIWHGLLPSKREEKILSIEIITEQNYVKIVIDDNGVGRKEAVESTTKKTHHSMGMQIVEERIELYNKSYSGKIEYKIIDKKNEDGIPAGTRVVLLLFQKN